MELLNWLTGLLEFLGGARDDPPPGFPAACSPLFWGIWWGVVSLLIYVFSGQSSKFIYIDF